MENDAVSLASESSRNGVGITSSFHMINAENIDPDAPIDPWLAESDRQLNFIGSIIVRALIQKKFRQIRSITDLLGKKKKVQKSPEQLRAEINRIRKQIQDAEQEISDLRDELTEEKEYAIEKSNHLENEIDTLWKFTEKLGTLKFVADYEYEREIGVLDLDLKTEEKLSKFLTERLKNVQAEEYELSRILGETRD